MPTHWTRTLIPTLRQVPAEAEVPSHQLMLRGALIRRLAAGIYDYLPLGWRSLRKAMQIVREEMDAAGAVEVHMPVLHPIELWEQTGRRVAYGDNLFVLEDRHGRAFALGPTHEEVFTEMIRAYVESYKDLPLNAYQIQDKFRDEFRPRFGLLRCREFYMKDAYSFHTSLEGPGGLDEGYDKMYAAYCRIFDRCGVPYRIVEAESGPIGGSASHEFMVPSPTGEDTILESDKGNYAANMEKAETGQRQHDLDGEPTGELEDVHTPGCPGIADVCTFFKENLGSRLKPENMLKVVAFVRESITDTDIAQAKLKMRQDGSQFPKSHGYGVSVFLGVVRGDHEVNEAKFRSIVLKDVPDQSKYRVRLMDDEAFSTHSALKVGFIGPHIIAQTTTYTAIVDPDAAKPGFWVTGNNDIDHHCKHFNWQRDVVVPLGDKAKERIVVADIRNAIAGDPSPKNDGGVLRATRGIELGHIFKLGTKYSDALDLKVLDENNERQSVLMGCYGIGIGRILASAIEREGGHDDKGIIWSPALAPYHVLIVPIKYDGRVREVTDKLAEELEGQVIENMPGLFNRVEVLIDDRDERPGVKFNDADLIGIPVRITVGDKGLNDGVVEIKARDGSNGQKGEAVAIDQAAARCMALLGV